MQSDGSELRPHMLVVERDVIIGYGLAEDLSELGYRVSGPCGSYDEVATLLSADPPDGAIIDIGLRDGAGLEAARALRSRGIPVVFFSAGDRKRYLDGEFKEVPWVDKPASTERVLGALKMRGRAKP
jgi:DNA-binding response OmpR family regulator